MQNRYAGDIGDFVKLGLLRALSPGRKLGVAWYLKPDEAHNNDGRFTGYLDEPDRYARFDPDLFNMLKDIVRDGRAIADLRRALPGSTSSLECLSTTVSPGVDRRRARDEWFGRVLRDLEACDLVFADPDNGIVDDADRRKGSAKFSKQIPLKEVRGLARGRCAVIYHHNTRRRGGNAAEIDHWLSELGSPAVAVRARAFSPRTFFILNPDREIEARARRFCAEWAQLRVELHRANG